MIILNLAMILIAVTCSYVILQINKDVDKRKRIAIYIATAVLGFLVVSFLATENFSEVVRVILYSILTIGYMFIIGIAGILELPEWRDWYK